MAKYQFLDKEIREAKDGDQVRILGTIVEKGASYFTLEDGTGKIKVNLDPKELGNYKEGQLVRVFGRIEDDEIDSMLIQSMKGFNLNLYKKVKETLNRFEILENRNV